MNFYCKNLLRAVIVLLVFSTFHSVEAQRPRELGIEIGVMKTGKFNAITDVHGVSVAHFTKIEGESIRTGVTAILPHGGN
ncbi:MAG: P1 family peptidase, partial [Cyclobacteriaceae bacterium]|nr:P1 family peptidase [Cyclobacteriaceae bacterium]